MPTPNAPVIDPALKQWATPKQSEYIDAVIEFGSGGLAAEKLGVCKSNINASIASVRRKAARAGYAPGHFDKGVAPGYLMGKVTVQRGPGGVERTWERMSPDAAEAQERIDAALAGARQSLPRLAPLTRPINVFENLLNLYTLTDYHLGMKAWAAEGGADWDLDIAERTLTAAFEQMVSSSPRAGRAVINIQGDFLHTDGKEPVTPLHKHVLDAAGRYAQMVHAAVRVLRRVVDLALMQHGEVEVIFAEGNHDLEGSMWLRMMFAAIYENEPRLSVNGSELPYYVVHFGKVMLGIHHGHMVKNDQLPLIFASSYPETWGASTKRYAHTGHRHHRETKEHAGMIVEQHPTLAARDAYAARGGWIAERAANAITYHSEFGEVGRTTVTPEMLKAA